MGAVIARVFVARSADEWRAVHDGATSRMATAASTARELLARLQEAQNDASEARAESQQAEARVAELLREARQAESDARRQAEMERAQQRSG